MKLRAGDTVYVIRRNNLVSIDWACAHAKYLIALGPYKTLHAVVPLREEEEGIVWARADNPEAVNALRVVAALR